MNASLANEAALFLTAVAAAAVVIPAVDVDAAFGLLCRLRLIVLESEHDRVFVRVNKVVILAFKAVPVAVRASV